MSQLSVVSGESVRAEDSEPTVTCLGTSLASKNGTRLSEGDDEYPVFCFSPLLIGRSDSKKSLSQREDYESAKTNWPVPSIEALFLPEFKVDYSRASRYFPLREVAHGSFGRVFEAVEKFTGQRFALKILSKSKIVVENAVNQAKEEVEIGRMIGHHVFIIDPPVYWQNRRNLYIATRWAAGGDLHSLVNEYGALPEELTRIYVAQIAIALEFLHSSGIIYRDLKAENVLLNGSDLSVRLSDFGLAKRLKRGARTSTICGTLVYSAPEIGDSDYDHSVDWWSLGILMHVLLVGNLPRLDCAVKFGSLSDSVSSGINGVELKTPPKPTDNAKVKESRTTAVCANNNKIEFKTANSNVRRSVCNSLAFDLSDEKLSSASRDLMRRLTNFDPSQRPRSTLALSRLAFFVGFDLTKAESANRVAPRLLVDRLTAQKDQKVEMISTDVVFFETEQELFPVLV
ncbi:unnamed protein product [Nesidiocoris tenuis]|uniref:Protein kinase domain-containing protein n=1 Tax=Nesidiocoris tenuis TaxID=355587 RepID=A0A6H5HRY5_9HEMI|nr:unnamed protein product [Nesidiocoris tenuis]